jgi:hypothetical protein
MKPLAELTVEATEENFNLLRAADIIEKTGWCANVLEDAQGRHCVVGALNLAQDGTAQWRTNDYPPGYGKLRKFLGCSPVLWNNLHCSGADECVQVLRECARSGR